MNEQRLDKLQRLLDYQFKLDDPAERVETERLLAEDDDARQIDQALRKTLEPLTAWQDEAAPAGLAERTMEYIRQHEQAQVMARASAAIGSRRASAKAEKEVNGSRGRWVLHSVRDLVAVAAGIMIIVLVSQPGFRHARQLSRQQQCAAQMAEVGAGTVRYANDNQGYLPYVKHQPGAVWWNVGNQNADNTSNTRNPFLLVKGGYLPARVFVCPGTEHKGHRVVYIDPQRLKLMQDFASRDQVNYSFRLMFDKRNLQLDKATGIPMMTDQNPLFAGFNGTRGELDLGLEANLQQVNSPNHGGRGQSILYPDGRVRFVSERHVGPGDDDIFTIKSATRYRGNELPESEEDIFIAP